MKFQFESNLEHQSKAVESIIKVFKALPIKKEESYLRDYINPLIDKDSSLSKYLENIKNIMEYNGIYLSPKNSNIIDIMMETGTGKTFTYTKAMFELNREYGINKFIVIVPTLSIKAGTINFMISESAKDRFKTDYGKTINLYVVESQKSNKNKKDFMPSSIKSFVEARKDNNKIEVLLINQGMLNSETLSKNYDRTLFDRFTNPFEALASINAFVIIDEPHRFKKTNKTWQNIQKLNPQFILRFGATFEEFENLIYTLTAAEAFTKNLVKGVIGYIEKNDAGKNALIELVNIEGSGKSIEAIFKLKEEKKVKTFKLKEKESLSKIHNSINNLYIEKMNKNEVLLSNGMILRKKDKINPYVFNETIEESMIKKAIEKHFETEKELIENRHKSGKSRIKPLTLFFIDNIDEYRNENGKLRKFVEKTIEFYLKENLKKTNDEFYKKYLENSLKDISKTHGGYFSKDNQVKDEEIEKEINEILHDKYKLLNLDNTRRFIFSKWTLKEGWDNPNVFQICKLRSSGSEISKLQEVGRGLRLPVNEHGLRVKEEFFLNYFVDFTEENFVDKLINEINEKSNLFKDNLKELTDEMLEKIAKFYNKNEKEIFIELLQEDIIDTNKKFLEHGLEKLINKYPEIFEENRVLDRKIKKAEKKEKHKIKVRTEKYNELKYLWEKINQQALLEIKVDENEFEELFYEFFVDKLKKDNLTQNRAYFETKKVNIKDNKAYYESDIEDKMIKIKTISYKEFVLELSKLCKINVNSVHKIFLKLKKEGIFDINDYLNYQTLRTIKYYFDEYLLLSALENNHYKPKLKIDYKLIETIIHPTKLTDKKGKPLKEINAYDIGINHGSEKVADSYYFEELFYDSELEKENIISDITIVEVFTKIPKNSIKIPIIGGKSYSPDFAYVLKDKNDKVKKIYFVIETKDKEETDLNYEEKLKIQMAEKFFNEKIKIIFKKQLKNKTILTVINEVMKYNKYSCE